MIKNKHALIQKIAAEANIDYGKAKLAIECFEQCTNEHLTEPLEQNKARLPEWVKRGKGEGIPMGSGKSKHFRC